MADILDPLDRLLPELQQLSDRTFALLFTLHIKEGAYVRLETRTWDSNSKPVQHENAGPNDSQLKRIKNYLLKTLPTRFVRGYYGQVMLFVSIRPGSLSFGFEDYRQITKEWAR